MRTIDIIVDTGPKLTPDVTVPAAVINGVPGPPGPPGPPGEDGKSAYQAAVDGGYIGTEEEFNADLARTSEIVPLSVQVRENTTDIESLKQTVAEKSHFYGYYNTTAEILALPNPSNGDFAWNAETGTVWRYDGGWDDTGEPIPDQSIQLSDDAPYQNGIASPGLGSEASRWDHVHPSDPAKANTTDIPAPATTIPAMDATPGEVGSSERFARADHVHPKDTSKADAANVVLLSAVNQTIGGVKTFIYNVLIKSVPSTLDGAVNVRYMEDNCVLKGNVNQSIYGTKTFTSPIVCSPAPTLATHLTNKGYVDGLIGDINTALENRLNGQ